MLTLTRSSAIATALILGATTFVSVRAGSARRAPLDARLLGPEVAVGAGTARTFIELGPHGEPAVVGIRLTADALRGLPEHMNTTSRCFDKDGDGTHAHGECLGDYQSTLAMPPAAADLRLPVTWATVNWNPEGHMPPAPPVWSAAHYDFHFFLAAPEVIDGIRPGPCGEFIDCEDFKTATVPLPEGHHPADYIDVGAAVPAMGNHLVDAKDPELLDPSLGFSRTFIYGVYGGTMIFLEPMVSHAFLSSQPDACTPLKTPQRWAAAGYYPTSYCVRYDAASETYRVTLEGLVYRR